jgi:predicted RNA methylase
MLRKLLQPKVIKFIQEQEKKQLKAADFDRLLFNKAKYPDMPMELVVDQLRARKKAAKKLPEWHKTEGIIMPPLLSLEQCSSEITAKYKVSFFYGGIALDLTGGAGVDAYYLSKKFSKVIYIDPDKTLTEIAKHNFKKLGATNIKVLNTDAENFIYKYKKRVDFIYMDPSRRNGNKKLFLLKDCTPNVLRLQIFLFRRCNYVLLKASPMLDIKKGIAQLKFVREVHVVAVNNEVKELLFMQKTVHEIGVRVEAVDLANPKPIYTTIRKRQKPTFSEVGSYLYEPNAAILKSGKIDALIFSLKTPIFKIHANTHLFTSNELIEAFPGRKFIVEKILRYDKKEIRKHIPSLKANIATRNFPDSVKEIRKKTGIKPGGKTYLFGITNVSNKIKILLCSKI